MRLDSLRPALFGLALVAGVSLAGAASCESYLYDVLDRLTSVTADNGVVTYYCYDAAGNRTYVGTTACAGGGGAQFESMARPVLTAATSSSGSQGAATVVPSTTTAPRPVNLWQPTAQHP